MEQIVKKYFVLVKCATCDNTMQRRRSEVTRFGPHCRSCKTRQMNLKNLKEKGHHGIVGLSRPGKLSATWRGGFKYWRAGRFGKDKDGLSWKKQRALAWERDGYKCLRCDKEKTNRNPDVHHISPYRISFSHALINLRCLCKKCHKIEDAEFDRKLAQE